jgi:hypothetical protein
MADFKWSPAWGGTHSNFGVRSSECLGDANPSLFILGAEYSWAPVNIARPLKLPLNLIVFILKPMGLISVPNLDRNGRLLLQLILPRLQSFPANIIQNRIPREVCCCKSE